MGTCLTIRGKSGVGLGSFPRKRVNFSFIDSWDL